MTPRHQFLKKRVGEEANIIMCIILYTFSLLLLVYFYPPPLPPPSAPSHAVDFNQSMSRGLRKYTMRQMGRGEGVGVGCGLLMLGGRVKFTRFIHDDSHMTPPPPSTYDSQFASRKIGQAELCGRRDVRGVAQCTWG